MKVLVCGGRDYRDPDSLWHILNTLHAQKRITQIIEGGASGADCFGAEWADENGVDLKTINADWKSFGRAAGPIRNRKMLDEVPDLVVAAAGGRGTDNMVSLAEGAGIKVIRVW